MAAASSANRSRSSLTRGSVFGLESRQRERDLRGDHLGELPLVVAQGARRVVSRA